MLDRIPHRASAFVIPLLLGTLILLGCGTENPASVDDTARSDVSYDPTSAPLGLALAPIEGLTTGWHVLVPAPPKPGDTPSPRRMRVASMTGDAGAVIDLPIPRGVPVVLSCKGFGEVVWSGVDRILPMSRGTAALCKTVGLDPMTMTAQVKDSNGERSFTCRLRVIDIAPENIAVAGIAIAPTSTLLREEASNFETMGAFFGESIAEVKEISPGKYRTGIHKPLEFVLEVNPPEFAPLMEWRIDGRTPLLNDTLIRSFDDVGTHRISVGPPAGSKEIQVETFEVRITGGADEVIPEGTQVTFTAETIPPGFEDEIVWLSSTKVGTATPTLGRGPVFTAVFKDTWDTETQFQWLGVKANEQVVNQDSKGGGNGPTLGSQLTRAYQLVARLEQSLRDASSLEGLTQGDLDRIGAALDQILDLKTKINSAIGSYAGLSTPEVAAIRAALDVAMPIINDLMDTWEGSLDDIDDAIALLDKEYVGDLLQSIGSVVGNAGDWFYQAGGDVRDAVPTAVGDVLGQAVEVVGTALNTVGTAINFIGSLWPFAPQPPRD